MSYSYECNVICDGCKQILCGETKESSQDATNSTERVALKGGWVTQGRGGDWLCPDCAFKDHIHEPDQP